MASELFDRAENVCRNYKYCVLEKEKKFAFVPFNVLWLIGIIIVITL